MEARASEIFASARYFLGEIHKHGMYNTIQYSFIKRLTKRRESIEIVFKEDLHE